MFVIGIFIHLVFLFSIFDIYFKSPIVNNANMYQPLHEAPADRLVLFVVDGLRAESFVNYSTMPYLRSVANNHGRWGISQTRVPTESRPGHVAIIAGFYEDPSAIAKGWKENPVDFDSVFNQSEYTWCWGTYDIVDIFTKGAVKNNIFIEKFDPYEQSFSSDKNTTLLDDWVFKRVKNFFHKANYDDNLREKLGSRKIVFFLHLLGTDTSGHTHKPRTKNFLTTIKFVDENIKEIEKIIKDFYNDDGKTTFLMTSDHGMTDWGSHGTGDDDETKTPYVLWGAGVQTIQDNVNQLDPETNSMSFGNRYDINQADLTPLMATFLSIPVPVNSIGQLPIGLLEMSLPNKAKAIYSNCRQMISQYNKKRLDVEARVISILYQPFEPFDGKKVREIISITEKLLEDEKYDKVIKLSEEIIHLSLSGLTYYHNYYQKPLLITVTLSFIGWILCLFRVLVKQKMFAQIEMPRNKSHSLVNTTKTIDVAMKVFSAIVMMVLSLMIYVQSLPVQYYIYFLMPIFLWLYALTPINLWIQTLNVLKNKRRIFLLGIEILCYTLGSIALGLALTHRWVLSIPLLGMSLWPFFSASIQNLPKSVCIAWPVGCVSLSIFSFMSVIGKNTCIELVIAAGIIWLLIHSLYIWKALLPNSEDQDVTRELIISVIQIFTLAVSLQIIHLQSKWFGENLPISQSLQSVCWIISVSLPLIPLLYTKKFINRLLGINTAILNFYLLLSVAHEGLFMVTLILNVNCWMFIESKLINSGNVQGIQCEKENHIFYHWWC
ncbi:GPI ethanolamine phosphate transferase 1 isoform X2 [Pararge aegeria]|uniref:GPI ethanolamine phosphate transferase 1 isoform X2 n=1 Tax=Pararge aegeria TaxID=116150 RepID=UPI0019CF8827|nr:GPI ethanolamine phosphate transferase 1 isoform X2 [Pararge aegeria]